MSRSIEYANEINERYKNYVNSDFGIHQKSNVDFNVNDLSNMTIHSVELVDTRRTHYSTCSCKDFRYRCSKIGIDCKHIIAVKEYLRTPFNWEDIGWNVVEVRSTEKL